MQKTQAYILSILSMLKFVEILMINLLYYTIYKYIGGTRDSWISDIIRSVGSDWSFFIDKS